MNDDQLIVTSPKFYISWGKLLILPQQYEWADDDHLFVPMRIKFAATIMLETRFRFTSDDHPTVESLFEHDKALLMLVRRCHKASLLKPFVQPPDDNPALGPSLGPSVLVTFDDLMLIRMAI
jgi:hypothetical protein